MINDNPFSAINALQKLSDKINQQIDPLYNIRQKLDYAFNQSTLNNIPDFSRLQNIILPTISLPKIDFDSIMPTGLKSFEVLQKSLIPPHSYTDAFNALSQNFEAIKIKLDQFASFQNLSLNISNETVLNSLRESMALDLENAEQAEEWDIIYEIQNSYHKTNLLLEKVYAKSEDVYIEAINFLYRVLSNKSLKTFTSKILYDLAINIIAACLLAKIFTATPNIIVINSPITTENTTPLQKIDSGDCPSKISKAIKQLRMKPSKAAKVVLIIPDGTELYLIKKNIKWVLVSYTDIHGALQIGWTTNDGME